MSNPCEKCFCYIYDTLVRPLPPSDPFYKVLKFKRLGPIASELTREIIRILGIMGDDFYINVLAHKELIYSCLLCTEAGFVHCNRKVSKDERVFSNPLSYSHQYLQRICTSLKMEIRGVHEQHCGLVAVTIIEKKVEDDDDLYA